MTERPTSPRRTGPPRRERTLAPLVAAIALLVGTAACGGGGASSADSLPEADLVSLDTGAPADLSQYRGTPMVVNLWSAWCPPCKREMPAIEKVHKDLGDDVAIIGVTEDMSRKSAAEAADKAGVTYPLLVDEGATFQSDLGVTGLPATLFIDADGKIVSRHLGAITAAELTAEIGKIRGSSS